jgi:CHAT domain-containing protein
MTRGFMYAGASGVVSSLWKVEDAATAELMKRFYRTMLKDNQPPAAALRTAQNELRRIPRFKNPRYWAGFTLNGEWR